MARSGPRLRAMTGEDIAAVMGIEARAYAFPWTPGIFRDCLRSGYVCRVLESELGVDGYLVVSTAAGEAHLLNLCVDPARRRRGIGRELLHAAIELARESGAGRMFLEVRPSNREALELYHRAGFNEIGRRPAYYPAAAGREDAILLAMELLSTG